MGDYIQKADWYELYALTQNWKSELLFYIDEHRFFRRLIDTNFGELAQSENLDAVRELEIDLLETDRRVRDLLRKTNKHLEQLALMVEEPKRKDSRIFRIEHEHLEDEIARFENSFRTLRKDVFALAEYMMERQEMLQLDLKSNQSISV